MRSSLGIERESHTTDVKAKTKKTAARTLITGENRWEYSPTGGGASVARHQEDVSGGEVGPEAGTMAFD